MSSPADAGRAGQPRPFLGVHMTCCNVYVRVYLNAAGDAFTGWCPRCAAPIRVTIDNEKGSSDRFFSAR